MLTLSKTFSETTPESAENGDTSATGFVWEDVQHTFRECVELLREHRYASCSPLPSHQVTDFTWFSSGWNVEDYSTCTERETSIHYSRSNPPRNLKYWRLAAKAAGLTT
ncbi:hypothetical protein Lumi_093 [Xylophilus phage Lumi]|nr:hypothetical protein Lumi_093 [Xylophilus phage Lumi]